MKHETSTPSLRFHSSSSVGALQFGQQAGVSKVQAWRHWWFRAGTVSLHHLRLLTLIFISIYLNILRGSREYQSSQLPSLQTADRGGLDLLQHFHHFLLSRILSMSTLSPWVCIHCYHWSSISIFSAICLEVTVNSRSALWCSPPYRQKTRKPRCAAFQSRANNHQYRTLSNIVNMYIKDLLILSPCGFGSEILTEEQTNLKFEECE